VYFCYFWGKRI